MHRAGDEIQNCKTACYESVAEFYLEDIYKDLNTESEEESYEEAAARIARYYRAGSYVEGIYADHVRQVRGRQQDGFGARTVDVLYAGWEDFVCPGGEFVIVPFRTQHDLGGKTAGGEGL